jgi:hypothetical protein
MFPNEESTEQESFYAFKTLNSLSETTGYDRQKERGDAKGFYR